MIESTKRSDSFAKQILQIDADVRAAFSKVKEEFEEHLTAINENTDEINNVHDRLGEMDGKVEKLNARLDTIHMMFQQLIVQTRVSVELSLQEQRAFAMLCTHPYVSASDMGIKTSLSQEEVEDILASLADKGIPIVRKTKDEELYLKLDDDFRKLQEKHHLVKVDAAITQRMENRVLNSFFS